MRISQYTEDITPTLDDLIYLVGDPNGTPVSRRTTLGNLIKAMGWVDVRDYGAKGDGVTDDTAAIQAAIDAVSTTYVPIRMPAGNFLVDYLELYAGTKILGSGIYFGTQITRRPSSTTGSFIRMKSGQIAGLLQLKDFFVECGGIGSDLNGIELGAAWTEFSVGSIIDTVQVNHSTGYGFKICAGVGELRNLIASSNKRGYYLWGNTLWGYNLQGEQSTYEEFVLACHESAFYGIEAEITGADQPNTDIISIENDNISLYDIHTYCPAKRRSIIGVPGVGGGLGRNILAVHIGDGSASGYPTYYVYDTVAGNYIVKDPQAKLLPMYMSSRDELPAYLPSLEIEGSLLINGQEIIANGIMEIGNPPTGWDPINTPETFEQSTLHTHSGSYSLHLVDTVGDNASAQQALSKTAGRQYALSVWYYLISGQFKVAVQNGNGSGNIFDTTYDTIESLQHITATLTETITGNTGMIYLSAPIGVPSEFYVDDVSLIRLGDATIGGRVFSTGGIGVGNSTTGDVTTTTPTNIIEIFDETGTSLGFIQVYSGP